MPRFDLPDLELERYRSGVGAPADLLSFWEMTLDAARGVAWAPKVERIDSRLKVIEVFDVTFSGFAGEPIKAWLHKPVAVEPPLPIVVQYCGYHGGRGLPHQVSPWAVAGYASLRIDARGQGAGNGWVGDTQDSAPVGPSRPGWMTSGILAPESYYYRRLYTDAVLAIDAARQLDGVDPSAIVACGTSQGGGIALATAGLASGLRGVMADVPFLCDFPRALEMSDTGPYLEIAAYLASHREHEQRVYEVLAYFDAAVLARTATAPALLSVALMDHTCPPSTVYAAYNAYDGPKEIKRYPFNGHEGGQFHQEAEQLTWLARLLSSAE